MRSVLPVFDLPRWRLRLYKAVRGNTLDASDARALFDLPDLDDAFANRIAGVMSTPSSDPALFEALSSGDFWAKVHILPEARMRAELVEDLFADGGLGFARIVSTDFRII